MLAITLFYVLFLILFILLIFVILLYSGYHSRTLAPPLLDTVYGFAGDASGGGIGTSFVPLYLADGAATTNGINGSLEFGASGASHQKFAFYPMQDDSQRKLRGNITLLINKKESNSGNLEFRIKDEADGKVVGDATSFNIQEYDKGLTEIKLYFTSNNLSSTYHRFVLEGKGIDSGVSANTFLLNSAYMYYY